MPSSSQIILPANTHPGDSTPTTVTGENFKGDGYYGRSDGVHTVQTRVTSLIASVKIQATLATTPADTDWVDIETVVNGDGSTAITQGYLTNFTGNYVWIRIAVTNFTAGTINTIILGH